MTETTESKNIYLEGKLDSLLGELLAGLYIEREIEDEKNTPTDSARRLPKPKLFASGELTITRKFNGEKMTSPLGCSRECFLGNLEVHRATTILLDTEKRNKAAREFVVAIQKDCKSLIEQQCASVESVSLVLNTRNLLESEGARKSSLYFRSLKFVLRTNGEDKPFNADDVQEEDLDKNEVKNQYNI